MINPMQCGVPLVPQHLTASSKFVESSEINPYKVVSANNVILAISENWIINVGAYSPRNISLHLTSSQNELLLPKLVPEPGTTINGSSAGFYLNATQPGFYLMVRVAPNTYQMDSVNYPDGTKPAYYAADPGLGSITSVTVETAGDYSNYTNATQTRVFTVNGDLQNTQFLGYLQSGSINAVDILNGGNGWAVNDILTLENDEYTDPTAKATLRVTAVTS